MRYPTQARVFGQSKFLRSAWLHVFEKTSQKPKWSVASTSMMAQPYMPAYVSVFLPLPSMFLSGSNPRLRFYQFALTQFSEDDSDKFSKEKAIANCLKTVDGVVRYFTWYQEGDEETSSSGFSFNLILELCEMDLYVAIHRRAPPVLPSEIRGVWESMLDVAFSLKSFHQLEIENTQFDA